MEPERRSGGAIAAVLSAAVVVVALGAYPSGAQPPTGDGTATDPPAFAVSGDLRMRQEILPNVYWFARPADDRNWLRVRARVGGTWRPVPGHTLEARFVNESRKIFEPDVEFERDETIVDRLLWRWQPPGAGWRLTLGRQDIIWNDGFLVFEGRPLDGSRAMCQNGALWQWTDGRRGLDVFVTVNPREDPWVIADDRERALRDGDERTAAARFAWGAGSQVAFIYKVESDLLSGGPTRRSRTLSLRRERKVTADPGYLVQLALQHRTLDGRSGTNGAGFAAQARVRQALGRRTRAALGMLWYSGAERWVFFKGGSSTGDPGSGDNIRAFYPPFGRWPKWSELYIYTLIGEGGVALWQDLAGAYAQAERTLCERAEVTTTSYLLLSPEDGSRGWLGTARLGVTLAPGLRGHLLWEWLVPRKIPRGLEKTSHFLRWELTYAIG